MGLDTPRTATDRFWEARFTGKVHRQGSQARFKWCFAKGLQVGFRVQGFWRCLADKNPPPRRTRVRSARAVRPSNKSYIYYAFLDTHQRSSTVGDASPKSSFNPLLIMPTSHAPLCPPLGCWSAPHTATPHALSHTSSPSLMPPILISTSTPPPAMHL